MLVVATIGPNPIGYVRCSVAPFDESGRTLLLHEIAVDTAHRRFGIGTALAWQVLEWADEMGMASCSAYPKDNRADRVAFLESVGFKAPTESEGIGLLTIGLGPA